MSVVVPFQPRTQHRYDHRLRRLVHSSGDLDLARDLGVPRSTALGWLREAPAAVVSHDVLEMDADRLRLEVVDLRAKNRRLTTICRFLLLVLRTLGVSLAHRRMPEEAKPALLKAVERVSAVVPLAAALRILGLSPSRYHGWLADSRACSTGEQLPCLRRTPNQLTPAEVTTIRDMVTSPDYRHVPTSRLAVLAQRLGKVFASASTWHRLVRENHWRRPRSRAYPRRSREGLRTTAPNQAWHVDVTVLKLLDGTKLYLHAVVDNFSRRILAWHLATANGAAGTVAVVRDAVATVCGDDVPTVVVDGGSENFNGAVDDLLSGGLLRRVLAQTDISFSNSMVEAIWRALKHQWLHLNTLDCDATVRRLVTFFVEAHNSQVPHSAFQGQTPDEMHFGRGDAVPAQLEAARVEARRLRLEHNRAATCGACARSDLAKLSSEPAA